MSEADTRIIGPEPDDEQDTPDLIGQQLVDGDVPKDVLGSLRQQRAELTEQTSKMIAIQGYENPILLAEYRLIDGTELSRISRKVSKQSRDQWQRNIFAAMDTLIAGCTGFFVDLNQGEGPIPLTLNGNHITGYTPELATALGFEASTARLVVSEVFANNELAIAAHSMRYQRWLGNTNAEVDLDFFEGV
jgi:hypothetical protein